MNLDKVIEKDMAQVIVKEFFEADGPEPEFFANNKKISDK